MSIDIVLRSVKGSPLNATEFDQNPTNLAAAVENISTGHDHDGSDSKKVDGTNLVPGTEESQFIVTGASPFAWIKKTLAQVKTLLGISSSDGPTFDHLHITTKVSTSATQLTGQSMIAESSANEGQLNYANDANRVAVEGRALEIIVKSPNDANYYREILSNRQDCIKHNEVITY